MLLQRSKFQLRADQAEKQLNSGNAQAAIRLYHQALAIDFQPDFDSWQQYFDARINQSTALKDAQQYVKGRNELESVIKMLAGKKIEEQLKSKKKVAKLKASATHNLAKLELAFSYGFKAATYYESYRKSMNEAYRLFQEALAMVVDMLTRGLESGQKAHEWWTQEYLKIKSNYLELLLQEGEQFEDKRCLQAILTDSDRATRFLKAQNCQKGEVHLYRCYYYKSMALKVLGRTQESFKLLLQDYDFQIKHKEQADAKKSKRQLLRYCLDNNLIPQGRQYANSKQELQILQSIQRRREQIKNHFSQSPQILCNLTKEIYVSLLADVDEGYNQYLYDYRMLDSLLQQALETYKNNPPVKGQLYYYLAECNYRLGQYSKAERMIAEALRLPNADEVERRDWQIEQFMIRCKISSHKSTIRQRYDEMMKDINHRLKYERNAQVMTWLEKQKEHLIEVYQEFTKFQQKAKDNTVYNFQTPAENRMLALLQKPKQISNLYKGEPSSQEENFSFEEQPIHQQKVQKKRVLNPQEEYIRRCSELGLVERQDIKQALGKGGISFNPFPESYNMNPQQLLLLLPMLKIENLDLRNHVANDEVLASIVHSPIIRMFKLSGNNQLSNQTILKSISKMSSLAYLSFLNFHSLRHRPFYLLDKVQPTNQQLQQEQSTEQPRSLTHVLLLLTRIPSSQFTSSSLRVLKLKYCNLYDEHLEQMDFQPYINLQEVSLSHNLLEGRQFTSIMTLKKINKINFSDNPLRGLSLEGWKHRLLDNSFILKQLKLKDIIFGFQLANEVTVILQRVRSLDVSGGKLMSHLISVAWNHYLQGHLCVSMLEQWIMKGVDLDELRLQQLIGLIGSCPGLQKADLRYCKHNYHIEERIQACLGNHKMKILLSSSDYNPQIDCFDLPPNCSYRQQL